jgi:hypothetical protein
VNLRNDWRHDQERHAHGNTSEPEEAEQSSKTAGRMAVAARRRRHENYPARVGTVPQHYPNASDSGALTHGMLHPVLD